jgi:hypothetical protein
MKTETQEKIKSLKRMIESCFTYGGAEEDDYNFKRYILKYKDELGEKAFYRVYRKHLNNLKENYTINHNVYTDGEGVTYNSLVKTKKQTLTT